MELFFFSAFGLSLAMWAAPGAVTTEAVRRGLTQGVPSVLFVLLGSLVGDGFWVTIACISAALLAQNVVVHTLLGIVETLVLLSLAGGTLKAVWARSASPTQGRARRGGVTTGALLSLANPYTIMFWLGVNGMRIPSHVSSTHALYVLTFFLGFLLAALIWSLFLCLLVVCGQRLARPNVFRWMNLGCGLVLGYFGLTLLGSTLQVFLM